MFLGKNQRVEAFMLPHYMAKLSLETKMEFAMSSEKLCTAELKTHVNKRFGLHQIAEAMAFYKENQTAGKVLLRPDII